MVKLNHSIAEHLGELDHQQRAIGAKYNALQDLLVTAQTTFDINAINLRVCFAVELHTTPFKELLAQAKVEIDTKYDDISKLHQESQTAINEAIKLCNGPSIHWRALAVVDNAVTAAVAPNELLAQRISEAVQSEVTTAIEQFVAREVHP